MTSRVVTPFFLIFGLTFASACNDIGENETPQIPDEDPGTDPDPDPDPEPATFTVRIDNVSGSTALPTPFAPGVWAAHTAEMTLFDVGAQDRGEGLEALAEDGDPSGLNDALTGLVAGNGVFNTPVGAGDAGPLLPGGAYEFTFTAEPGQVLSFASMLVQSNDLFIAPDSAGIALFDGDGAPLAARDITDLVALWDAGTEANQAPGIGPNQAPRQGDDFGGAEGVIRPFTDATRAIPLAHNMAGIAVTLDGGAYTITVTNISEDSGANITPLAPLFYATHNSSFSLFTEGMADRGQGLETLAEDGSPAGLIASYESDSDTGEVGSSGAPAGPGGTHTITVTPTADYPYLTVASMVVESNDAFLAFSPAGIALLDADGNPRAAEEVQAEMIRDLAVWDAGTEANEVPGVGANQALRQAAGNTGPVDPDNTVRLYRDATNDLADLSNFVDLSITSLGGGQFEVTVNNVSNTSPFSGGIFTPVLWATGDGTAPLFEVGSVASAGIEAIAEDGNPAILSKELAGMASIGSVAVEGAGPFMPGTGVTFTVELNATSRYLHLVSMIVPSNDTLWSLGGMGIELIGADGNPLAQADIDAAV
ncbi:MAG: spondin domain-containing protein, partial [Myxococcota bacterium]